MQLRNNISIISKHRDTPTGNSSLLGLPCKGFPVKTAINTDTSGQHYGQLKMCNTAVAA